MSLGSPKSTTLLTVLLAMLGLMLPARSILVARGATAQPLVRGISIHDGPGGTVVIDIAVTHPVPYQTEQLSSPGRLVVDLEGAREANLRSEYRAQSQLLERVRTGQWKSDPAVFRVVADLKGNPTFIVKVVDSGLRIELKPRTEAQRQAHGREKVGAPSSGSTVEPGQETAHQGSLPDKAFQVHRFKDLSASLTAPVLPPHDRLVPVAEPHLTASRRKAPAGPAVVSGISIQPGSQGETTIDIASSLPVPYRVSQLANPFRLVIDLKDARNASSQEVYPVNSPVLKRVRIGQSSPAEPSGVRVVADLEGYPIFDVYAQRPGIRIDLKPRHDPAAKTRNPFKFDPATQHKEAKRPVASPHQAVAAGAGLPPAAQVDDLSNLALIGLIEKNGAGTQAVISHHSSVYLVSKGDTFENSFTVVAIAANAVQVQDTKTLETRWIAYSH
ncbi:MAG TPA: AMIN domain-containing protein [Terriglobia bacterium]|nr:AMIN domain-containing protein [Terriglobia bacterium]